MTFEIPKGDSKFEYVQDSFSRIAAKYDLFNDLFTLRRHRGWKRFLIRKSGTREGDTVLDICCGTGDITNMIQSAVGERGTVIGLDFSTGMLNVAKTRRGAESGYFIQGDANRLPFLKGSVDTITVGYGLRNLVDYTVCLKEVYRVLKPGGKFLCLETGKVRIPLIKQLVHLYFFHIIPKIGKAIYPEEEFFDYFPRSSIEFPSQRELADQLQSLGFVGVRYYNFYFGSTAVHVCEKPL